MCGYSWTTAPKCEYCPECCHEMDKIEGEQSISHLTINEGDVGHVVATLTRNKGFIFDISRKCFWRT
jgi:hypothetical protein